MTEYIIAVDYDTLTGTITKTNREEIVRCRDCEHYIDDEMEYYHYCGQWCGKVAPDGFCAWGERRSDARSERIPYTHDELLADMRVINDEWAQERTCRYNERDMELAYLRGWEDAQRGLMPDYKSVVS